MLLETFARKTTAKQEELCQVGPVGMWKERNVHRDVQDSILSRTIKCPLAVLFSAVTSVLTPVMSTVVWVLNAIVYPGGVVGDIAMCQTRPTW